MIALNCLVQGVWAQTPDPRGYIFEDFTSNPTGWSYSGFSSNWNVGVDNSSCLRANIYSSNPAASITTSYVVLGTNPVVSFKYKATNYSNFGIGDPAASNSLQYSVSYSTNGTTWTDVNGYTNRAHVSSADYTTITVSLPGSSTTQMMVRITFSWVNGDVNVWLDDVAVGTVPPIFFSQTLDAGTVYNNYSTQTSANTRTHSITNKGSRPLTLSVASTTGGASVTDVSGTVTVAAFTTRTISVTVNAYDFLTGGAYNGSITFNTNDPNRPTVIVNVTGTVRYALVGINEDFTSNPTGWSYSGFSSIWNGGVDNSSCLRANIYDYIPTASVETSYVAVGTNPSLSFKYKATNYSSFGIGDPAASNSLQYTVSVSRDAGATWTNLITNRSHVSSADFTTVTENLSPATTYNNQIVWAQISFSWVTGDIYVWLDDIAMGPGIGGTTYTVTYDINGGSGTTPAAQTVNAGEIVTLPNGSGFSRSGYTFGGWNINSSGTGTNYNAGSSYTPTSNITLYARWYPVTYTVSYNINGGNGTTPAAQTVNAGGSVTLPNGSGFSRSGYTFGGWNINSSGTGTNYNAGSSYTPTGNITLYAKWNPDTPVPYTVTYNINGGTGTTPTAQTVNAGNSVSLPGGGGFSRSGYTFGGWNTNSSGTGTNYNSGSSYTPTGNITLYAKWNPNTPVTYTVTYNINGGSGTTPAAQTVNAGNSVMLPGGSGFSRSGYTFVGWNTNSSGTGTHYNAGDSFTPTDNITLYARWNPVTYTVTYNITGGNGTLAAKVDGADITSGAAVEQGKSVVFTATPNSGYRVKEWTLNGAVVNGNTSNTYTLDNILAVATVTVAFEILPAVTAVTVTPSAPTVKKGTTQLFSANVTVTGDASTGVTWSLSGNTLVATGINASGLLSVAVGETVATLIVTATSTFDNTKYGTATVTVASLTSAEISDTPLARVYPNPTEGTITLEFEADDVYNITLADMTGKTLMRQTVKGQRVQVDIGDYPAGVYLLTIDDGKRQNTTRVVKN